MQRREIWILVAVVVLIGVIWTVHSLIDTKVGTETAPVERSQQQNAGSNAPSQQIPAAGTNGATTNP